MTDKTFYFVSGLPRAGSTLLLNVLAQNPRFHATATSGCMDVMFGVRNSWDSLIEHRANPNPETKRRVLCAILESYYADIPRPVVFDKCRGWVSLIEMAEWTLRRPVKILVPIRDIRDVLASFEKLWRKQAAGGQVPGEQENYFQFQTVAGRCEFWMRPDQPVGLAYGRLQDAIVRGYRDRMHFIRFDDLTSQPAETMRAVYEFLEEEPFEHGFEHVEQVTTEDDSVHGFQNLHAIRPKIEPVPPRWPTVLKSAADRYAKMNFWDE